MRFHTFNLPFFCSFVYLLLILSIPTIRCRHAQFAAYFGDEPPSCVNRCDVCVDPAKVSQLLTGYKRVIYGVFSVFSNHLSSL